MRVGSPVPNVVRIVNVKVIAEGHPKDTGRLTCEVGGKVMTFHAAHRLPGTTIQKVGDIGILVLPLAVAITLGLG